MSQHRWLNATVTEHGVPSPPRNASVYVVAGGEHDADGDGPDAARERRLGTHPFATDSDGDGLLDRREASSLPTDPARADTDGDGSSDAADDFPANANRSIESGVSTLLSGIWAVGALLGAVTLGAAASRLSRRLTGVGPTLLADRSVPRFAAATLGVFLLSALVIAAETVSDRSATLAETAFKLGLATSWTAAGALGATAGASLLARLGRRLTGVGPAVLADRSVRRLLLLAFVLAAGPTALGLAAATAGYL
ncbi:hypothetical protein [Halobaculum sp. D14]|uniref:hypothetical protein n=1 Tax=Halobaculum sp. D14 TaxID=3421642 RepID=UPI003EBC0487